MVARLARSKILYGGCYTHIILRSIRKLKVFQDEKDFESFQELLFKVKQTGGFKIYHYCLLHTHFHLAVEILEVDKFFRAVQNLKSQYIYRFHERYKSSGPIWRERYKSLLIENEAYLYACGQYIENNPVKAGIVRDPVDWQFSSVSYYMLGKQNKIVDGYEGDELPVLPKEIDINDERIFERGFGIGTSFFRFQLAEKLKMKRNGGSVGEL